MFLQYFSNKNILKKIETQYIVCLLRAKYFKEVRVVAWSK